MRRGGHTEEIWLVLLNCRLPRADLSRLRFGRVQAQASNVVMEAWLARIIQSHVLVCVSVYDLPRGRGSFYVTTGYLTEPCTCLFIHVCRFSFYVWANTHGITSTRTHARKHSQENIKFTTVSSQNKLRSFFSSDVSAAQNPPMT